MARQKRYGKVGNVVKKSSMIPPGKSPGIIFSKKKKKNR